MPIRLEHQPSPIAFGMAGYAAGTGARRQRQQKYALDLFQQDRMIRERRQDQLEDRAFAEDRQDQRQSWMEGMQDKRQTWMETRDAKREWETMPSMSNIPDTVLPETRRELADLAAQVRDARHKFAYDDPAAIQADRDARDKYEDIIRRHEPPSEADAWNRGVTYVDENPASPTYGKSFETPGDGRKPYRGGQRAVDNRADQAAAEKQAKEQAATVEKEATRKYQEDMDNYNAADKSRTDWDKDFYKLVDEITKADETISGREAQHRAGMRMVDSGRGTRPQLPARPVRPSAQATPTSAAPSAAAGQPAAAQAPAVPEFVVPQQGGHPIGITSPAGAQQPPAASPAQSSPAPAAGQSFDEVFGQMSDKDLGIAPKPVATPQPQGPPVGFQPTQLPPPPVPQAPPASNAPAAQDDIFGVEEAMANTPAARVQANAAAKAAARRKRSGLVGSSDIKARGRSQVARGSAARQSAIDQAIAAAQAGDPDAQRALDERKIRWRK
jgi:hypothetical protein